MAGEFSPGSVAGVNFDFIRSTLGQKMDGAEQALRAKISSMDAEPTQTDLMMMQVDLQKWTMMIQLQSTINKELGDALKGVIQKSA